MTAAGVDVEVVAWADVVVVVEVVVVVGTSDSLSIPANLKIIYVGSIRSSIFS